MPYYYLTLVAVVVPCLPTLVLRLCFPVNRCLLELEFSLVLHLHLVWERFLVHLMASRLFWKLFHFHPRDYVFNYNSGQKAQKKILLGMIWKSVVIDKPSTKYWNKSYHMLILKARTKKRKLKKQNSINVSSWFLGSLLKMKRLTVSHWSK